MLRFLCQACSVNYYNPVTQSIVRISNFILKPFDIIGLHLNSYILFLLVPKAEERERDLVQLQLASS